MSANPPTILFRLFLNLAGVLFMACGCTCCSDIILKSFLYIFSTSVPSLFSASQMNDLVLLERNTSYNSILFFFFFNFAGALFMCLKCGCGLHVIVKLINFAFFQHWET